MPRSLTVRWDDFEAAFIITSPDAVYFVNTDTGDVEYTSHMDGETVRERILKRTGGDQWIEIPRATYEDGIAELKAFAEAEPDAELSAALVAALAEKLPPRAFNRALGGNVEARRRWSAARMAGIHQRLLAFCTEHDLVIDDDRFRALLN